MASYLHDLVLELGQEEVDDLVLLDGKRVQVDLLHALDLASLHQTAQLGDGLPLFLLALAAATTTAATTTAATITTSTVAEATAGSTTSVSHVGLCKRELGRSKGCSVTRRILSEDGTMVNFKCRGWLLGGGLSNFHFETAKFCLTSAAIRSAKQFSGANRLAGKIT